MPFFKKTIVWILTLESRIILKKYKPFIVAVTGSVGKTSTKDAIFEVVKSPVGPQTADKPWSVRKSEKSLNSEIGLPLTIIGAPNAWHDISGWIRNVLRGLDLIIHRESYPDCLVLEIGADHPGDIKKVVRWLKPDIAVITKISRTPVHVEFFSSPGEVFEEKAALAAAVKREGSLILFADDDKILGLADRVKDKDVSLVSYGLSEKAMVRGSDMKVISDPAGLPIGMSLNLTISGVVFAFIVHDALGQAYAYSLLAAAAVGKARNMNGDDVISGLNGYRPPKGRMNLIPGMNGSMIIDDTYNSSPDAVEVALETLRVVDSPAGRRKIAVLGDMMELGKYAAEEHRHIGGLAADIVSQLVTVGPRSRTGIADEAGKSGMAPDSVHALDSSTEAGEFLKTIIRPGDVVLVKGSQSMRMERVVKAIMREPEKAKELLVRQEKEWLEKA